MDFDEASRLFEYRNGQLFWKQPGIKRNLQKPAGHTGTDGYTRIMLKGKMYLAHSIIWLLHYKKWPEALDHIDQNQHNGRIENLRETDASLNGLNISTSRLRSRTKTLGVSYEPRTGKFYARLKKEYLGTFTSCKQAAEAYRRAKGRLGCSSDNKR